MISVKKRLGLIINPIAGIGAGGDDNARGDPRDGLCA
jgi:hypothetical protein